MIYECAYGDLAARERAWASFLSDPEWQAVRKDSEVDGPLVERFVDKIFRPTPFAPGQ